MGPGVAGLAQMPFGALFKENHKIMSAKLETKVNTTSRKNNNMLSTFFLKLTNTMDILQIQENNMSSITSLTAFTSSHLFFFTVCFYCHFT